MDFIPTPREGSGQFVSVDLETVPCVICGSTSPEVLRRAKYPADLSRAELSRVYCSSSDAVLMDGVVRCRVCKLVFLSPRVPSALILSSYENAVDPRFSEQNAHRIKTFTRVFSKWMARFKVPTSGLRVLDVGCAGGAFPRAASLLGHDPIGVEPSRFLAKLGRSQYGLDIRSGTLADQTFENRSFDIVSLWDVIEHLSDPGAELDRIRVLLRDDGFLIVNYPEYDCWQRRVMGWKWPFFLSVHLFYFTPRTIKRLLAKHGFEALEVRAFYQTLPLGYVLERASQVIGLLRPLVRVAEVLRLSRFPFTYSIGQTMVTARKATS